MRCPALVLLTVLALGACGGGSGGSGGDSAEVTRLALQWYRDADAAVCDHMTNKLLAAGWGEEGAQGREACKKAVAEAGPVGSVEVAQPEITGDSALAAVSYTLSGNRQTDNLYFVREVSAWLIDEVKRRGQ
jgi:hypothetical protein